MTDYTLFLFLFSYSNRALFKHRPRCWPHYARMCCPMYFKVSVFALIVSTFEQWLIDFHEFFAEPDSLSLCGTTTSSLIILNNIHSLSCLLLSDQTPAVSTVQLQFRAFSHSFLLYRVAQLKWSQLTFLFLKFEWIDTHSLCTRTRTRN